MFAHGLLSGAEGRELLQFLLYDGLHMVVTSGHL
jgi:hypothetical protein